jgi:hypothetical protein
MKTSMASCSALRVAHASTFFVLAIVAGACTSSDGNEGSASAVTPGSAGASSGAAPAPDRPQQQPSPSPSPQPNGSAGNGLVWKDAKGNVVSVVSINYVTNVGGITWLWVLDSSGFLWRSNTDGRPLTFDAYWGPRAASYFASADCSGPAWVGVELARQPFVTDGSDKVHVVDDAPATKELSYQSCSLSTCTKASGKLTGIPLSQTKIVVPPETLFAPPLHVER